MIAQGAQIEDDQFKIILDYLSKTFPPAPPKTINLNAATAADMEKAFGLAPSESAAIIQYRSTNGKFSALEDLKKVPGLTFSKIEAQKDRITF
jgi:competence protein ComEA